MPSPAEGSAGSGPHILLVEDESAIRRAATAALESAGYRVDAAADIEGAEKALARVEHDLALIDLHLRDGQGGFMLLRRIGASGSSTRAVVFSSTRDFEDILAAFRLGAVDFVPKPLRSGELLTVVKRALRAVGVAANQPEALAQADAAPAEPEAAAEVAPAPEAPAPAAEAPVEEGAA